LGNEVVGLTTVQLNLAPPSVLLSGLSTLSSVSGWSFGQAQAIIKVLLSGSFKVIFKPPIEQTSLKGTLHPFALSFPLLETQLYY